MNPWSGGEVPLSLWGKEMQNVSSYSAVVWLLTSMTGWGNIPGTAEMCYAGETLVVMTQATNATPHFHCCVGFGFAFLVCFNTLWEISSFLDYSKAFFCNVSHIQYLIH